MSPKDLRSVLVVDDDEDLLDSLREVLRPVGILIEAVPRAQDALDRMATQRYDAVLTDFKMAGMSGIELLVAMKDRMIDSPVVMLTGCQDQGIILQALRLGAMDFIHKPTSAAEVVSVMRRAVELGVHLREQERELDELVADLPEELAERLQRLRKKRRVALLWTLSNHAHKAK
jgi:FixJ family two-component response regulator